MKTTLIVIFFFCVMAVIVHIANSPDTLIPDSDTQIAAQITPDAVAVNPIKKNFSESGELISTIKAAKLEFFKASGEEKINHSLVINPIITFYESGQPWELTAEQGLLRDSHPEIILSGNVLLFQSLTPGEETQLETDVLEINIEGKHASTDEPVKIESPYGTINAKGMYIDFINEKIELLSDVAGHHEPI